MEWKRRLTLSLAVLALVVGIVACGGQPAEEPAAEEPAAEEPVAEEPAAEPEPVEPPAEEPATEEPQEPQLVGEINIADYELIWDEENTTAEEAPYEWTVTVQNDTTQTLDITVTFDTVDASDDVVKTHEATIRLAPAERGTIRENDVMTFDQANRVISYVVDYDWEIIES